MKRDFVARSLMIVLGLLIVVQTATAAGAGASPATGVEQALIQMENDWVQAGLKKDAAALERIMADDWVGTDYNGKTDTKAGVIADMKSGASVLQSIDLGKMKVRVFGDTAVVTGSDTEKSTWKGKDSSGHYVWTDVFVKRNGKWQAVASQSSKTK
jgi:ketosteroid isomerase-like protein